jgi:hypothetical protein
LGGSKNGHQLIRLGEDIGKQFGLNNSRFDEAFNPENCFVRLFNDNEMNSAFDRARPAAR